MARSVKLKEVAGASVSQQGETEGLGGGGGGEENQWCLHQQLATTSLVGVD